MSRRFQNAVLLVLWFICTFLWLLLSVMRAQCAS